MPRRSIHFVLSESFRFNDDLTLIEVNGVWKIMNKACHHE
jgi:hypothetical protein